VTNETMESSMSFKSFAVEKFQDQSCPFGKDAWFGFEAEKYRAVRRLFV
jgi:hypothetical protein